MAMGLDNPEGKMTGGGRSIVAQLGFCLLLILLSTFSASAWWIARAQRLQSAAQTRQSAESACRILAQAIETTLAQGDPALARRLIAAQSLPHVRLTMTDGSIVADRDSTKVTRGDWPERWPTGNRGLTEPQAVPGDELVMVRQAIRVPERGELMLEIGWPADSNADRRIDPWTGLGLIAASAMAMLLLVYHRSRAGFQAWDVIRQSLLSMARGDVSPSMLAVSTELGAEAEAWNAIVADRQKLNRGQTVDRARAALDRRSAPRGELDEVCDAMSQGLLLLDEKLNVKYANGAAAVFLAADRAKLPGADLRSLAPDEAVKQMLLKWQAEGHRRRISIETQRKGEGAGVLRWSIRPVRREDNGASMLVIEDVTQQRVAEEARNSFVAHATHELRAPLTNIRLYLEMCVEDGEKDPATRAKCLNVIGDESRRLERIVSDMLSTAQIEAGSFRLKKDDLRLDEILTGLKMDYEPQAAEKGLTLAFNLPPKMPVLHADRDMVMLALHNLLSNAMKYTPKGGSVTVNADANDSRVAVEIHDTGIGISEADQAKLFEKFYRANDKRIAGITGTGLGLALARQVTRLHGGDITLQSQLDKGSAFTMTLPLTSPSARA